MNRRPSAEPSTPTWRSDVRARWIVFGVRGMLAGSLVACSPARAQTVGGLPGLPGAKLHSSLGLPATACPAPAKAAFSIEALHEPVDVAMDFTLAEIIRLAEQTGWTGNYIPLGFSIAKTGYRVILEVNGRDEEDCSEPVKASVLVMLTDRRIEIAKDLKGDPNCLSTARHHYILHAASDDAVLTQFAEELSPVLSPLTLPNLQHNAKLADEDRVQLEGVIRAAIDRVWPSLPVAMRAASKGVDSPDAVAALVHACQSANGLAPYPQTGTKL